MTVVKHIGGWIFPGSSLVGGVSHVPVEIADGRALYDLRPEYYRFNTSGGLVQLTVASGAGVDGYTSANAALVKRYSAIQWVTISGNNHTLTASGLSSLSSNTGGVLTSLGTTMVSFLQSVGYAGGVILDVELPPWNSTKWSQYKTVISSFATALHAAGFQLAVSGPGMTSQGTTSWNWSDLDTLQDNTSPTTLNAVDLMEMQVYDYMYGNGGVGVALAPLSFVTSACNFLTSQVTHSPATRLGVTLTSEGYFGTVGDTSGGTIVEPVGFVTMEGEPGFSTATRDSGSSELQWTNSGTFYDYNDSTSLNAKIANVTAAGIQNISIFYIGDINYWPTIQYQPPLSTPTLNGTVTRKDTFASRSVSPGLSFGTASDGNTWNTLTSGGTTATTLCVRQGQGEAYYDNSGQGNGYAEVVLGAATAANSEVLCRFAALSSAAGHFGLFARYTVNSQWYRCNLNIGANYFLIEKMVGGTFFPSLTTASFTFTIGTYYWVRFKCSGSTIQVRIWADGATEPSTWNATLTDTSVTASGQVGMMLVPVSTAAGGGFSVDSFSAVTVGTVTISSPYSLLVLDSGPAAYYRLDELSGLVAFDSSGNGNDATITSVGVSYNQTGAISGDSDAAMLFNGSTGYIDCTSGDLGTDQQTNFTIEAWIKLSNTTFVTNPRIAGNNRPTVTNAGFAFYIGAGGTSISFDVGANGTVAHATASFTFTAGTYYHVAGTYDGTSVILYVNGVARANISLSGPIGNSTSDIGLAWPSAYAGDYFPGDLDEVAIYYFPLPARTILSHYNVGAGLLSYLYQVVTGSPILHQDVNQAINVEQQPSGGKETGKYYLAGNSYISGGYVTQYMRTLSQLSTPVSVSIDTSDQAVTNLNVPTTSGLTSNGFRIQATSTGIATNCVAGGNYTVNY